MVPTPSVVLGRCFELVMIIIIIIKIIVIILLIIMIIIILLIKMIILLMIIITIIIIIIIIIVKHNDNIDTRTRVYASLHVYQSHNKALALSTCLIFQLINKVIFAD